MDKLFGLKVHWKIQIIILISLVLISFYVLAMQSRGSILDTALKCFFQYP